MISKETFVKSIKFAEKAMHADNKFDAAVAEYYGGCRDSIFGRSHAYEFILDLLAEAMQDDTYIIDYLFYECDCLNDYQQGIIELDEVPVILNDWGDVYDLLKNIRNDSLCN